MKKRNETKLFYKVISVETLFWITLILIMYLKTHSVTVE